MIQSNYEKPSSLRFIVNLVKGCEASASSFWKSQTHLYNFKVADITYLLFHDSLLLTVTCRNRRLLIATPIIQAKNPTFLLLTQVVLESLYKCDVSVHHQCIMMVKTVKIPTSWQLLTRTMCFATLDIFPMHLIYKSWHYAFSKQPCSFFYSLWATLKKIGCLNFHRNSCMFEQSSHFSFDTLNLCFIALHSSKESVESMKWPFFVPQAPSTPFIKPFARLMSL